MGLLTIDMSSALQLAAGLRAGAAEIPNVTERMISYAARDIVNLLSDEAPDGDRPDPRHPIKTRESFSYRKIGPGKRTIVTSAPHKVALIVSGTAPHYIYPRYKKKIAFPASGGGFVVVPWVGPPFTALHPGTKKNDFITRALNRSDLGAELDVAGNLILVAATNKTGAGNLQRSRLGE